MLARILQLLTKLPMPFSRSSPEKTTQFGIIKKKVQVPISQNTRCFNPSEKYARPSNWIHLPQGSAWRYYIYSWNLHTAGFTSNFFLKKKTTSSCQCLSWNLGTGFHFAHRSTQIPSARTKQANGGRILGASTGSCGRLGGSYREDPPGATTNTKRFNGGIHKPFFEFLHPPKNLRWQWKTKHEWMKMYFPMEHAAIFHVEFVTWLLQNVLGFDLNPRWSK